jgi:hypothetical protein
MRPTLFIGMSAILALAVTFDSRAEADGDNFDTDLSTAGQITITTGAPKHPGFHVNAEYTWTFKWGKQDDPDPNSHGSFAYCGNGKCPGKAEFSASTLVMHGLPSGKTGTLRGAVCTDSDCRPFKRDGVTIK